MAYKVRRRYTLLVAMMLLVTSLVIGTGTVLAKTAYEDGQYTASFQVFKDGTNEPSATSEYMNLSAQVTVTDGKVTAQVTLKNSSWWQEFKVKSASSGSFTNVKVVSENKESDTRVVSFPVVDIEQVVQAKIHIIVTGIPGFEYDNKYDIQLKFDSSQLKEKQEVAAPQPEEKQPDPVATTMPKQPTAQPGKETDKAPSTTNQPKQPEKSSPPSKVEQDQEANEAVAATQNPAVIVAPSMSPDEVDKESVVETDAEVETTSTPTSASSASSTEADDERSSGEGSEDAVEETVEQVTSDAALETAEEGEEVAVEQTKQSSTIWIWVIVIIVLLAAVGSLLYMKKRRM